jgi:hypothetical protein
VDFIPDIISIVKAPASAGAVFVALNRLGAWLDSEVEGRQKDALREYLKSGQWLDHYQNFIEFLYSLYNRVYGPSAVSRRSLRRAVQLSVYPFVFLTLWSLVFDLRFWFSLSWETVIFGLIPRLLLSIAGDVINIAGSRWTIRRLLAGQGVYRAVTLIGLDFLRAAMVVVVANILGLLVFQVLYTAYVTGSAGKGIESTFISDMSTGQIKQFVLSYLGNLLRETDALVSLTSLIPTVLMLIVGLAAVFRALARSFPIDVRPHMADLRYTKPFSFIFSVVGYVAAGLYLCGTLFLKVLQ